MRTRRAPPSAAADGAFTPEELEDIASEVLTLLEQDIALDERSARALAEEAVKYRKRLRLERERAKEN